MKRYKIVKKLILVEIILLIIVGCTYYILKYCKIENNEKRNNEQKIEVIANSLGLIIEKEKKDYIKWVEFNVSFDALCYAYQLDVDTYNKDIHLNWIELLAYCATKHGGEFPTSVKKEMRELSDKLSSKEITMKEVAKDLKNYNYYYEVYSTVLSGFIGEYQIQTLNDNNEIIWKEKYGLKVFSPISKGFAYQDYDDFGASRSYGYARPHLGHDMMGLVGTPIIAVESGYVEAIGWNRYGGWRIGIRSFDGKRYYYYAHLRQNRPYSEGIEEGSIVTAGDVIGYMGHTGYSTEENVNNIKVTHLHWGLQLIFDESQKECDNEIWINCYNLTKFLYKNKSQTVRDEDTKEWHRSYKLIDPSVEQYKKNN
ncbi:MAG TPA: M23 family metallopeptidase [Lachnospiraceae bacterium]|nr:M23 family metallopeptidase [Lachnospiraceae bacterium]